MVDERDETECLFSLFPEGRRSRAFSGRGRPARFFESSSKTLYRQWLRPIPRFIAPHSAVHCGS